MKEKTHWNGKRMAPISQFTNSELNDSIGRLQDAIESFQKKNNQVYDDVIIPKINNLMAQLVAERANRIGKEG